MVNRILFVAACFGLGAGTGAAADLKSGPEVGKSVSAFHPLNVTGKSAGEKNCLVWENGGNPVAIVFARELSPSLTGLVKSIDTMTVDLKAAKAASFVVMLSDDDKLEDQLKKLDEKEHFKKTVLTIDNVTGPKNYSIAKEADVTVVLYRKKKVEKTFAFTKGKVTEKDSAAIVKEFKAMAEKKEEKKVEKKDDKKKAEKP